jgi:hypothetical protein
MSETDERTYATPEVIASYDALALVGDAEGGPSIQTCGSSCKIHEV